MQMPHPPADLRGNLHCLHEACRAHHLQQDALWQHWGGDAGAQQGQQYWSTALDEQ